MICRFIYFAGDARKNTVFAEPGPVWEKGKVLHVVAKASVCAVSVINTDLRGAIV